MFPVLKIGALGLGARARNSIANRQSLFQKINLVKKIWLCNIIDGSTVTLLDDALLPEP